MRSDGERGARGRAQISNVTWANRRRRDKAGALLVSWTTDQCTVARTVLDHIRCTAPLARNGQARRARHSANVLGRIALARCAASEPVALGVVSVDDTNLWFHGHLRGAAQVEVEANHLAPPSARRTNLLVSTADSQ